MNQALESSGSFGFEGFRSTPLKKPAATPATRDPEGCPSPVNAEGITVVSQIKGFSVGMQPGEGGAADKQQQQQQQGEAAGGSGRGISFPDESESQMFARLKRPPSATGSSSSSSRAPAAAGGLSKATGAAGALPPLPPWEEANGGSLDDDDAEAEERKIKAKQQSRIQKMLKKKSVAPQKKPTSAIFSSSPYEESPKAGAYSDLLALSGHRNTSPVHTFEGPSFNSIARKEPEEALKRPQPPRRSLSLPDDERDKYRKPKD